MSAWATEVTELVRGPLDIAQPGLGFVTYGIEANVIGVSTASSTDVVSLGDGGSITLFFESGISDGLDDDLAVYENGFLDLSGLFGELAYVEVSTDGTVFARFDSDALNTFPVGSFGTLDPTEYHGLAGRHPAGLGTGFDLEHLSFDPLVLDGSVDLNDIQYVRIVDVIGDGSTVDGAMRPIYDPYTTAFAVGGFDLEAIGVIHVPEPGLFAGLLAGLVALGCFVRREFSASLRRPLRIACIALFGSLAISNAAVAATSTFDDIGMGPAQPFLNGSTLAGGYTSAGIFYENSYFPSFDGFSGFAASTTTDTTTPGFGNQFSNITGSGEGSDGFGVFFLAGSVILPSPTTVVGASFTNTTYAALSMRDGDSFAKAFGGVSGDDPDFFRLIIEGIDRLGDSTGTVEVTLADYTYSDNSLDFILDEWLFQDLTGLGVIRELQFSFQSSDVGDFGINTPQYFAIDNLITVPEPGSVILLGLGLAWLSRPGASRSKRRA